MAQPSSLVQGAMTGHDCDTTLAGIAISRLSSRYPTPSLPENKGSAPGRQGKEIELYPGNDCMDFGGATQISLCDCKKACVQARFMRPMGASLGGDFPSSIGVPRSGDDAMHPNSKNAESVSPGFSPPRAAYGCSRSGGGGTLMPCYFPPLHTLDTQR